MPSPLLTIDDLLAKHPKGVRQEAELYKFVRLADGRYIFHLAGIGCLDHQDMLCKEDGPPKTAGTIALGSEHWRFACLSSWSLGIGADSQDETNLTILLGRSFKTGW